MSALNYKDVVEYYCDKYHVLPSFDYAHTITKPAGRWHYKIVVLEWYNPAELQQVLLAEFPVAMGWVYTLPEPTKPSEEIDLINVTIHGHRKTAT